MTKYIVRDGASPICAACGVKEGELHKPSCWVPKYLATAHAQPMLPAPSGDPDGPLVPLPVRSLAPRIVPPFPLAAYEALLRQ